MKFTTNTIIIAIILVSLNACTTLKNIKTNLLEDRTKEQQQIIDNQRKLELMIAQVMIRLDELEQKYSKTQAKIQVLEKGLMLGIIPEELKVDSEKAIKSSENITYNNQTNNMTNNQQPKNLPSQNNINTSITESESNQESRFAQQLAHAEELFRSGQYAQAILAYSNLEQQYPLQTKDGTPQYWIALSWFLLKDYPTALEKFQNFIKQYPQNSRIPNAHFYIAKIKLHMGLINESVNELKTIIKDYPTSDACDMAKMELKKMEYNL